MSPEQQSEARDPERRAPSKGRRVFAWLASLAAAALLLALVVRFGRIDLWPDPLVLPAPWLFVAACAVQIPYTLARALRLRFVLDPLVAAASAPAGAGGARRFDWRVLQGSGMLSYPIVIMLPFRLGELSRPLLLTRAQQPGVGFAESVSAIAVERVVDGLVVVGMLFFGLGFASVAGEADAPEAIAYVRGFGRVMAMTFVLGLALLLAAAARPALLERIVSRTVPGPIGRRAAAAAGRIAGTIAVLFNWRRGLPFLLWSLAYWCLTICQLWLVLRACGLELGFADAAAVVAIVGLAIQLPGGPAQAGSFQFGMVAALSLLTTPAQHDAASSFAALMYLLQLGGACALALPGGWLLARARRDAPPPIEDAPADRDPA